MSSVWYLREVIFGEIQASGRTQAQVCEAVGLTSKHMSSFLNGHCGMQLDLVDRILAELGRELVLSTRVCPMPPSACASSAQPTMTDAPSPNGHQPGKP